MNPITSPDEKSVEYSVLERKYFETRKRHEDEIEDLKAKQSARKKEMLEDLKRLKGVSKKRIHNAITLMKKMSHKSVEDRAVDTYDIIINTMERSFKRHYEDNIEAIISYIIEIYTLQDEMKAKRAENKRELDSVKEKLRSNGIDPTVVNMAYNEYKTVVSYIKNNDISIEEYNEKMRKYAYLDNLIQYSILKEYSKIESDREILENEKAKLKESEDQYMKIMAGIYGIKEESERKKKESKEDEITDILMEMFSEGVLE